MTVYPFQIDDDTTIIRIDDNLSELGTEAINQLRSAMFAVERELGINPSGALTSVASRLDVSINPNGTIKSSALTSVGLATLPIDDAQVGSGAGIKETKLALDYSTADLNAQIVYNSALLATTAAFVTATNADLLSHIAGATLLSDGATPGRHVASHIDINSVPFDARDLSFVWTGLLDKDGNLRTATTVAQALLQINDAFVDHQLDAAGGAHTATGIFVDTSQFTVIPQSANTVQKSLDAIDDAAVIVIQTHQANQHTNGVPRESRTVILNNVDGYNYNIVPPTQASAYLTTCPVTTPTDNNTTGDDIISFNPDNTSNLFDEKFAKVGVGDTIRINYGNGIEGVFNVMSKRHIPGVEWIVRINGTNLYPADGYSSYARIDKRRFENNNWGTVSVAVANNDIDSSIMPSVIVGNPKSARVLGINFDPTQFDSSHFNLYLAMYPTGDPTEAEVILPPIDVTGDQGVSPGKYTIESVVQTTNDAFRSAGYNYRFMAFEHEGEFGIMMTDAVSNASFSIINGVVSGGSLISGPYGNNVIDDAVDGRDPLGFGFAKASVASPKFSSSYSSALGAATYPTVVHPPLDKRDYSVNGISRDSFATTYATTNGYWDGYISNRVPVGATTVEITYEVPLDLTRAELRPGKTITVQPTVDRSNALFNEVDYGRFVIKSINFTNCCDGVDGSTSITVVNGLHATASPTGVTGVPPLAVRLYFGEDSVTFNQSNVIDAINNTPYFRYHEIFINEEGKTFSHERARMPIQLETGSLLGTASGFKVRSVSPKLKGFIDDGATDPNRFVRFMVTNYDSTSGEFDGYLGRRIPSTDDIVDFGRLVTARKNVPTRFYDNTDIDYIEIEYVELNQYPGTDIMSTNSQRYVDIEVFDSLATNQENFRLAGCGLVSNNVEGIYDLREFGNVSEVDFTTSAIKFIEAGERHLHGNGVVQGFTFKGEDELLPGTLKFNGGIALVNGHMSTLNAQSISIPEIVQDTGAGQTSTLNWAVCVNDEDLLEAIPITNTKQHFFARRTSDVDNYYIPSLTYDELLDTRKDLLPIYVANVTIASVTVNSVLDVRNFIKGETGNIEYTIADDGTPATFSNFDQVINRAALSEKRVIVRVVGDVTIDTAVDMSAVDNVTIKGGGGKIIVNSDNGLLITSGIVIEDVSFQYDSVVSTIASNISNLTYGVACINLASNATNCRIAGCSFTQSTSSANRPPYIAYFAPGSSVSIGRNIQVIGNNFITGGQSGVNTAVALYVQSANGSYSSLLFDVRIENNTVNGSLIASSNSPSVNSFVFYRCSIKDNYMFSHFIGYSSASLQSGIQVNPTGLTIAGNNAGYIVHANGAGQWSSTATTNTGAVTIRDNECGMIWAHSAASSGTNTVSLNIKNNNLFGSAPFGTYGMLSNGSPAAIYVGGSSSTPVTSITGNTLTNGDGVVYYTYGIYAPGARIISNNILDKCWTNTGIVGNGSIIGNNLSRENSVTAYISISSGVCTGNILDQRTIDGSSIATIVYSTGSVTVEHNVNHVKRQNINMQGFWHNNWSNTNRYDYDSANQLPPATLSLIQTLEVSGEFETRFTSPNIAGTAWTATAFIPWYRYIPSGSKITAIDIEWESNAPDGWDAGSLSAQETGRSGTDRNFTTVVLSSLSAGVNTGTMSNTTVYNIDVLTDQRDLRISLNGIDKAAGVVGAIITLRLFIEYTTIGG